MSPSNNTPSNNNMPRFFDSYDRFYRSSPNGWKRQRLNDRYDMLFGDRPSPLCGKVVLDLGSHDGRWSFAALACGATKVVGIEGSERLISRATDNMKSYGVSPERYEFVRADAIEYLRSCTTTFDVVLCLGFLYHTAYQVEIVKHLRRLTTDLLILDSQCVADDERPALVLRQNICFELTSPVEHLTAVPTRAAIRWLLDKNGFVWTEADWQGRISDAKECWDYSSGQRVTLFCRVKPVMPSSGTPARTP